MKFFRRISFNSTAFQSLRCLTLASVYWPSWVLNMDNKVNELRKHKWHENWTHCFLFSAVAECSSEAFCSVRCTLLVCARSSLIHFACIGVAPPQLFHLQLWQVRGSNFKAVRMDQTWSWFVPGHYSAIDHYTHRLPKLSTLPSNIPETYWVPHNCRGFKSLHPNVRGLKSVHY